LLNVLKIPKQKGGEEPQGAYTKGNRASKRVDGQGSDTEAVGVVHLKHHCWLFWGGVCTKDGSRVGIAERELGVFLMPSLFGPELPRVAARIARHTPKEEITGGTIDRRGWEVRQ